MNYDKILKREDGSRVKIDVRISDNLRYGRLEYSTETSSCEKGKRTWIKTYNTDCYKYRRLSMDERRIFEYDSQFNLVTEIELQEARLELWNKLKPTVQR